MIEVEKMMKRKSMTWAEQVTDRVSPNLKAQRVLGTWATTYKGRVITDDDLCDEDWEYARSTYERLAADGSRLWQPFAIEDGDEPYTDDEHVLWIARSNVLCRAVTGRGVASQWRGKRQTRTGEKPIGASGEGGA